MQEPNDRDAQYAPRSRPVSFYDNFKDVPTGQPCVTSAMSVGNLNQVCDNNGSTTVAQKNNNNINNNRVSTAMSAGNVNKIQCPKITGAVSTGNIGKIYRTEKDKARDKELGRAPSMANCLSTTVPVNLAASQIAGRHTPTRNSLRHSRMIVMNRIGHYHPKTVPPLLHRRRLARCLAALQTILGVAVTSLSLWLLLWAPNLPVIDNPYWSGMSLLVSGSFGICLLCCFKREYSGMNPGCCLTSTKVISSCLATLATITCTVACVASIVHLIRLTRLKCSPTRVLNATCVCRPYNSNNRNETISLNSDLQTDMDGVVKYIDLNCPEVESILTILLIFSAVCNALGAIISGWYSYLHWSSREKRPQYIKVRTNPNSMNSNLITDTGRSICVTNRNGR